MKPLCIIVAAALLAGCTNPKIVERARGSAMMHVYQSGLSNTWRAAINAARRPPLSVDRLDEANRYIAASSGVRMESWGEMVGVWVNATTNGTRVEVVSQRKGPAVLFVYDWRYEILRNISLDLGEPLPPEPPLPPVASSPRGKGQ